MFLVGIMSWWYNKGLTTRISIVVSRVKTTANLFSVKLLIHTLFSPYKQISAEVVDGSLRDKFRAFFDKLLSRIIGDVVRSFMIIAGLIIMAIQSIFGVVILVIWLIIPFVPVIGLILFVIGWMPL
jgi:hypothetical protein